MTLKEMVSKQWVWRGGLAIYLLCLIAVIFVYFVISAMQVPTALYLNGTSTFFVGEPSALRGHLLDARDGTRLKHFHRGTLTLQHTTQPEATLTLPLPEPTSSGELLMTVQPPESLPEGDYELRLRVSLAPESPAFEARAPVRLTAPPAHAGAALDAWPIASPRRPIEPPHTPPRVGRVSGEGEVWIDTLDPRPILSNGLPDEVVLRTWQADSGEPLRCTLRFDTRKGMTERDDMVPAQLETDALGMATLSLTALTLQSWELSAECPQPEGAPPLTGKARVQLDVSASQLRVELPQPLLPHAESELRGNVRAIHRQGEVYADLYRDTQWLQAQTNAVRDHGGGVALTLPPELGGGLYRVQVYNDAYRPGFAWDSAYLWRQESYEQSLDEVIAKLLMFHVKHRENSDADWVKGTRALAETGRLEALSEGRKRRLLAQLLEALPRELTLPDPLINSFEQDQRELDAWKKSVRGDLLALIAAALLLGIAILGLVVLWGIDQAQRRNRLYQEVALELDDEADAAEGAGEELARSARAAQRARWMVAIQGGVVFGTLILFAACIWLLMRYMM